MAAAIQLEPQACDAGANEPSVQYERFSTSAIWAHQRAYYEAQGIDAWRGGVVPHYITSTAGAAETYADAIVAWWQVALAAGDVDPQQPLYVLELGAGCGRFTYLLQKALRARTGLPLCYLASDIVEANLDFIASHPYLAREVEAGRLDTALWDAEAGGALRLRAQGLRIARTANPVAVVANYVFDGLRHELFACDCGRLLEGRVALVDGSLDSRWEPIAAADWLPPAWQGQLARYAGRLSGTSLLFPSGPLRCLGHIERLTRGRYLLLSADKGVHSEQQLRAGGGVGMAMHGCFSLPVNYHAIAACLREQGGLAANVQQRDDGLVYQVALRAPQAQRYAGCVAAIAAGLAEADDHFTLKKTLEGVAGQLTSEQLLAQLRLGRHDPRVLDLMLDAMMGHAPALAIEARRRWREALESCWANYFPLGEQDDFHFRFGLLAGRLGHWELARAAFFLGLEVYGEDSATLQQLAACEAATGRARQALELLERMAGEPEPAAQALRERLRNRIAAPEYAAWACREAGDEGELALEPLQVEHASELLRQYADPQIGVMTRLPPLRTLEEAVEWIVQQRAETGRIACAVLHREHGLVGAISLMAHAGAGYFWFWIGSGHQGAGWGRRAAALLFERAAANGVHEIFTSAYADNARSIAALAALGFQPLPASAAPPDDDLHFFHCPLAGAAGAAGGELAPAQRLVRLCAGIASPLRFVAHEPASH